MKRYTDVVINQFAQVIPGASVTVKVAGSSTLATLFSDDGLTAAVNPVTTDTLGRFAFYVADGRYDLTVTKGTVVNYTVSDVEIADVTEAVPSDGGWKVSSLNNVIYADQQAGATADVKINAAVAALPANGGTVDARGFGATAQTIAAPVTVGLVNKPVVLLIDRATNFNCTITAGGTNDCWDINPDSSIVALGTTQAPGSIGGFSVSNTANVRSIVRLSNQGGANAGFALENITIKGNSLATVSDGVVNLTNPLQTGTVRGLSIGGFNAPLLKITQTAGNAAGPINIENPVLDCQSITGCKPLLVQAVAGGGVMTGLNFFGGNYSHGPASTPLIDLQGITGSDCAGVNLFGPQLESSVATAIGININNCTQVGVYSPVATATSAGADMVKISGANTDEVTVTNLHNFSLWTNNVNDTVTPEVIPNTDNRIPAYIYRAAGKTHGIRIRGGSLPVVNGNALLDTATAQTLTNKTLTSPAISAPAITGNMTYANTTPVANLTTVPVTYNAAGTQQTGVHVVQDTVTLAAGTATVTLSGSAVFTNATSYTCVANDHTAVAIVDVVQNSGTSVTFNGTGTDVIRYICVGN